jgi:hypothetical protein
MNIQISYFQRSMGTILSVLVFSLFFLTGCNPPVSPLVITSSEGGSVKADKKGFGPCDSEAGSCRMYGQSNEVTLDPTADAGYVFAGWSGDCQGLGFCVVKMTQSRNVEARFLEEDEAVLTDISTSLTAVLEEGNLQGACERYNHAPDKASDYLTLMCGKSMFFYEGFELLGVPSDIIEFLINKLPDTAGPGLEKLGLITDPYSDIDMPLGMPVGAPLGSKKNIETRAFGCASCHFAKTPDGRYSVGQPNHHYDYGKHVLSMAVFPMMAMSPGLAKTPLIHADAKAVLAPMLAEFKEKSNSLELFGYIAPVAPLMFDKKIRSLMLPPAVQARYASWGKTGNQDFLIAPVGFDDKVHTVSKVQSLWELPSPEEMASEGGEHHALLGSTGGTASIDTFLTGFVALSVGPEDTYTAERLLPLKRYLLSLKAPANLAPAAESVVSRGAALFEDKSCSGCHDGPRYSSTRVYSFDEIGTDPASKQWNDKNLDGVPDADILYGDDVITNGIKSPRLNGLWAMSRFLHNGSVDSLEDLFCINHTRPSKFAQAQGDQGHMFTCDDLDTDEKQALIAFLKTL